MILVNTDYITGKTCSTIGLVRGSTIRAKHLGKDILAGLKTIVGGELTGYGQMLDEARSIATRRMVEQAQQLGADAVINIRYATSNVMTGAAEILVYGTAVQFIES
jgi:uncharacterized protein YbjQ (UPF0145 family)